MEQVGEGQIVSTPRAEWIETALKQGSSFASEGLQIVSARDFGAFTALSYRAVSRKGGRFVVDIWRSMGPEPLRYSPAQITKAPRGAPSPTGKE